MPVDISFNPSSTRASLLFSERPGNVLTADLVAQLRAALEDMLDMRHLRLLTIEGAGDDFSFGASIPEHTADRIGGVLPEMHAFIRELVEIPVATAAIVRGRCLGGGFELALACDFIFAADDATFGLPEIKLGVFPPAASVLLARRVGLAPAMGALLTGEPASAEFWRERGLVSLTAPMAELSATVDAWFDRSLATHSAEALRHAVRAARLPLAQAIDGELREVERLYLSDLRATHDASEGVVAFLEKRPPIWKDE
jgi:cyclohexa-1,5-dienecarbonyl-CoA hydratase